VILQYADLLSLASNLGFQPYALEKTIWLLELLEAVNRHPFLKKRMALKGGTALNLFIFDVPRLSVDIDVNYLGKASREALVEERPKIEQAVQAVGGRLNLAVRHVPTEHAGGKWRFGFTGAAGQPGILELDVNYMFRTPLWTPSIIDSRPIGPLQATQILVLDLHELVAGKLAAMLTRSASRDLFDVRELLQKGAIDRKKLRLSFVIYGGIVRKDWREISVEDVKTDRSEVERQLLPMLRSDHVPGREVLDTWVEELVSSCRGLLSELLPLESAEYEFISRLNDHGEIVPELLTGDSAMKDSIKNHPGLRWKAMNVLDHIR